MKLCQTTSPLLLQHTLVHILVGLLLINNLNRVRLLWVMTMLNKQPTRWADFFSWCHVFSSPRARQDCGFSAGYLQNNTAFHWIIQTSRWSTASAANFQALDDRLCRLGDRLRPDFSPRRAPPDRCSRRKYTRQFVSWTSVEVNCTPLINDSREPRYQRDIHGFPWP